MSYLRFVSPLFALTFTLVAGCGEPEAQPPASADALAFVNVSVVPLDAERLLEDQTVLVRGGQVIAMGPSAEAEIPPGAYRIDGAGKYLMPGLIDMHIYGLDDDDHLLYVANGVTTVRHMRGSLLQLDWRAQIERGDAIGPALYTASNVVDGPETTWNNSTITAETPEEARRVVADHVRRGFDFVRVSTALSREAYEVLVEEADKAGLSIIGDVPHTVGLEGIGNRTVVGLDALVRALLPEETSALEGERRGALPVALYPHLDWSRLDEVLERVRAQNLRFVSLLGRSPEAYRSEEALRALQERPEMAYVIPGYLYFWGQRAEPMNDEAFGTAQAARGAQLRLTRRLHDAGVPLLAGGNLLQPYTPPGYALHEELAALVEAGLTPYDALRIGSYNAAEALGLLDRGTVAVGQRADLVLLEGNPLSDIAWTRRIAGVMANGRWLPRADLDTRLQARKVFYEEEDRFMGVLESEGVAAARQRFEEMRRADPGARVIREERLMSYVYQLVGVDKDYDRALAVLALAADLAPTPWYTYDTMGMTYTAMGDTAKAIESYEKSLAIYPESWSALEALEKLREATEERNGRTP